MPKRYCVTVQYVLAGLIDDFLVGGEGGSHRKNLPLFGGGHGKKFKDWGRVMQFFTS